MSVSDGQKLIQMIRGGQDSGAVQFDVRLAEIDPNYTTGDPKVRFFGETTVGAMQYPCLKSYTPAANDTVLVMLLSHSGCILGKL